MKKRTIIFLILVVAILGLFYWWYWQKNVPIQLVPSKSVAGSNVNFSGNISASNTAAINPIIGPITTNAQGQPEAQINPALPAATQMQMILDAENGRKIDFYGKVVDQNGAPVAGAKVRGVIVFSSMAGTNNKDYFTETDGNGLFKFTNLHGPNFGAVPSKEGYVYDERQPANWSENYNPNPNVPIVFPIWKLQGAEPMVHAQIHDYIPCDGTEIQYNLLTGKRTSTGGGLIVKFIRNPVQIVRGTPFAWTLTLEVPGGGLIEVKDLYPYEAPENGYEPFTTIATGSDVKNYTDSASKTYYVKSADGKYGRLTIELQADFQPPPTSFDANIYLNLSGSRNLEYDRGLDPSAPKLQTRTIPQTSQRANP